MVQVEDASDWYRYFPAEMNFRETVMAEKELSVIVVVDLPLLTEPPFPVSLEHRRVFCSYYRTIF